MWDLNRKVVFSVDWVSSMTCPGGEIYEFEERDTCDGRSRSMPAEGWQGQGARLVQ